MSAIFLIFVVIAISIFFWNFLRLKHFYTDKKIFYRTVFAYVFLICGMLGFTLDFINLKKTSSLKITINAGLPDLIRAFSDLLYPLGGIIFLFWFAPQLLSFLKDHRYTIPLLNAWKGHSVSNSSYREISKRIEDLPDYQYMHPAQKEIIDIIENQLKNTLPENEKSLLLNYGTRYELIAKCEKTYNQIFGSQIQALKALVNNTYLDLTSFYDIHKIKALDYPDIQYNNFESWVQFLIETMLVIKNENGKYSLTEQGKYVIKYFEDNKLFLDRAF